MAHRICKGLVIKDAGSGPYPEGTIEIGGRAYVPVGAGKVFSIQWSHEKGKWVEDEHWPPLAYGVLDPRSNEFVPISIDWDECC